MKIASNRSRIGISFLILFAILYCLPALVAQFWNDNDTWSNLLPIIHYQRSILNEHSLPLYTDLWYGGHYQWANPLWSFLYLPATIVWLITPLDWGARIIFLGHLIFALLTARMLASLFLEKELEITSAAIILSSPVLPALNAGHMEKVMSWGWILLSFYFLLNVKLTLKQRGLGSGICLGIVPLTGANYYSLYAVVLLLPLVLSYKDRKLLLFFAIGSLVGLLHLPSVWQMIGHSRAYAKFYVAANSLSLLDIASSLATGLTKQVSWETWAPIGIPTIYLFVIIIAKRIQKIFSPQKTGLSYSNTALLFSIVLLTLLATGIAYRGHNLLDSFRVPSRALAFIALGIALFVLLNIQLLKQNTNIVQNSIGVLLFISGVQIAASAWQIRPAGSVHSPYEPAVQSLAATLKADGAQSVWFSAKDLSYMYIHVGLTRNNISLPVVYYGDMGQTVEITGDHCGYSFDHLITLSPIEGPMMELNADIEWSTARGEISTDKLSLLEQLNLDDGEFNVYRVTCNR